MTKRVNSVLRMFYHNKKFKESKYKQTLRTDCE